MIIFHLSTVFCPCYTEPMLPALLLLAAFGLTSAQEPAVFTSKHSAADFELTADPDAAPWRNIKGVVIEHDRDGRPVPSLRTEIRSRWTDTNLYFLFICRYEVLHVKPDPVTTEETNGLYYWDVAEVFVGSDFKNIGRYKEFEVSPQGEWIDLDIDLEHSKPIDGWTWNSGMRVRARIDAENKTWYGEMCIPVKAIDAKPSREGREMRLNLFRIQGPFKVPSDRTSRTYLAWRPTGIHNSHVPEAFGLLRLEK